MDPKKLLLGVAALFALMLLCANAMELAYMIHKQGQHHSALQDALAGRRRIFPLRDPDRCPCAEGECDCCRCTPQHRPGRGSLGDLPPEVRGQKAFDPGASK